MPIVGERHGTFVTGKLKGLEKSSRQHAQENNRLGVLCASLLLGKATDHSEPSFPYLSD